MDESVIQLSIKTDFRDVQRRLDTLANDMREKVMAAALNKVVAKGKVAMTRAITSEFAIKSSEVRARLKVVKASRKAGDFFAILEPFDSPSRPGARSMNLIHFSAKQVAGTKSKRVRVKINGSWVTMGVRTGGGVSVKVKRAGGRKLIKGAFIGNKGRTVFMREDSSRLPIKALQTIDVPQMFNTKRISNAVLKRINTELPIEFERAIKAAIAGNF